ncbi:SLAC1 anion channel family protein [Bosea eneae]|uniref:SLAC1 anion channel family protein n=1 Tax=Bosea eneae TaxID=151454 RepID=A0ABW0IX33_9HYPH
MTDAAVQRRVDSGPSLARAPVSLFAIVMGLGGLALAWRKAHVVFAAPAAVGETLFALAAAVFVAVTGIQLVRALLHSSALVEEFRHPVSVNFIPALSVSLALLSAGLAPYDLAAAGTLWLLAALIHLSLAFLILRRWFGGSMRTEQASPAWFIPVVGTMLMPVVGMPLGHLHLSWFLFSVGFVFWLILAPLMTHRLFFAEPLAERAVPSLFILLAPPAVGGLAVLALDHGQASPFSHVLFCFAAFIALLVASMLGRIFRTHFAIGWWALTFPSAAFASLALSYVTLVPGVETLIVAGLALAFATLIVAALAVITLRALLRGELVPPP